MAKVDVQKTMNEEIKKGIDILIQRKSKKIKCSCFDEVYQTGDSNCRICLGEGILYKIQKEKAILQKGSDNSNSDIKKTELGNVNISSFNLYLKENIKPSTGDKIFIASWNYKNPTHLKRVLEIKKVDPIINNEGKNLLFKIVALNSPKDFKIGKAIIKKAGEKQLNYGEGFYVRPI